MNREALIDAAIIAVEYELRILRRNYSLDTASLRFDLASPLRYRDALDRIERDYNIDVCLPMELMEMLHERPALKAVA
ncbi:hypothetical protein FHW12_000317 [Dokdonella fugitiva]|uniref:Uncharacterized protein n=1 Tax=Dokdonella fugitiva TaxID=328517 RepID=A0A839EUN5_9GAMM|nr:hypothetical protein [Dokdonella fugitiva]MBA8886126.1 hypothetical protein [Dokdonella fugitiva]